MGGKKWWQSKTILVGLLTVVAGVAAAVAGEVEAGGSVSLVGLVNIILRTVTREPLE